MPIAFVTIKVKVGQVKEVLQKVKQISNVLEGYAITGHYDIIIKIQGDKLENVAKMVVTKVHEIAGVQDTVTYLVVDL